MIGNALEDVTQVGLGVDTVEFGGADQRVDRLSSLAAGVGAKEQEVLAAERDGALRALRRCYPSRVVRRLGRESEQPSGSTHRGSRSPVAPCATTWIRSAGTSDAGHPATVPPGPGGAHDVHRRACRGDLDFDREQGLDPFQRLAGGRRVAGDIEIVERPPDMSPAGDFLDTPSLVVAVEPGIAIRLQHPVVVPQVCERSFPLAVRGVPEPVSRRSGIGAAAVVPNVGPEPAGLGQSWFR